MTSTTSNNRLDRPQVVVDASSLRDAVQDARAAGHAIGLVPTMGALHEGHLSLVRRSVATCGFTTVSIFVNPTQFGPHEDLSRYPRTLDADLATLAEERASLVFAPPEDKIYPERFSTYIEPPAVAQPLEGQFRPRHFHGVATVVLKLFHLVSPDIAFFGQKDYQQARVIQDMVRDLDLALRIEICPTVREEDGLAMSSRNRYLGSEERTSALSLYRALCLARQLALQGERCSRTLCDEMRAVLLAGGVTNLDYVALVDPETLQPVKEVTDDTIALIAAHVGNTRLIDNCRIGET